MLSLEEIKVVADIAIAIFTLSLVRATYILAKHTKIMNDRDMERQRREDLIRCISLAESIIRISSKDYDRWTDGDQPDLPIQPFNELLVLSKYIKDPQTRKYLENVTATLTSGLSLNDSPILKNKPLLDDLKWLRQRLPEAILEIQKRVGNYQ